MNKAIIGVAVVALVFSVLAFTKPSTVETVRETIKELGAIPGDSVDGNAFSVGGVRTWSFSSGLNTSSSTSLTANTVCSFKVVATSTLVAATMRIDANEAWEQAYEIGYATTPYATTTRLGIKSIAASVPGEIIASTTDAITGLSGNVLIPGRYINVKYATSVPSTSFNPKGECNVVYREI